MAAPPDGRSNLVREAAKRLGHTVDGKYRLDSVLGAGAAGVVYAATTTSHGRKVAVKLLHPRFVDDPEIVERFRREVYVANRIRLGDAPHPAVVPVLDAGRDPENNLFYLVERLLPGETLEKYLAKQPDRRLAAPDVVALIRPVIDAIAVAHEAGIVHRDLKPANVFIVDRGPRLGPATRVIDFGIAQYGDKRMTGGERLLGTPEYMSPEAFTEPSTVDARADVWAFGVMLYEALAGVHPFDPQGADWMAIAIAVAQSRPAALASHGVGADVAAVVERCIARSRDERFANARELQEALEHAVAGR